ncbi:unannotated protein [freshwater metagenome]|uniref:Unannotated protein n=1 Tax=freshwater metagenome TaxID=449393 RepID=A0A6J6ELM8_9ZZZZ
MTRRRGGGPRQLDRLEGGQAAGEEALGAGQSGAQRGELRGGVVVEQGQAGTARDPETGDDVVDSQVVAGERGERRERQRGVTGGDHDLAVDVDHLTRFADLVAELDPGDHGRAGRRDDRGRSERVRVAAEVEGTHETVELGGRSAPVEAAQHRRPVVASVGGARRRQVLRGAAHGAGDELVDQLGEGVDRRLEVAGVDRQRGLGRGDVEQPLLEHVALVDTAGDLVPRDAVGGLAVEQCPGRRVQARVRGERPVVEVDRAPRGQRERLVREDREVGDREQVVDGGVPERLDPAVRRRVVQRQPESARPVGHPRPARHHCDHLVPPRAEQLAALDEQAVRADQHATQGHSSIGTRGHRHLVRSVRGREARGMELYGLLGGRRQGPIGTVRAALDPPARRR